MNKHGTYSSWYNARRRCLNVTDKQYSNYGGRGIAMCARWVESYQCFLSDMGERPEGTSIERIDNDKGYEPSNCRWATPTEQARNRCRTKRFEHDGLSLTIAEWAERYGLDAEVLKKRIRNLKWPLAKALSAPVGTWSPIRLSKGRDIELWKSVIAATPSNKEAAAILNTTPKTICHWRRNHVRQQDSPDP